MSAADHLLPRLTLPPSQHVRVTLVAAARSSALLAERFDDDRPLDQAGWDEVQRVAHDLVPLAAAELRYCSPTPRSRATGDALGFAPLVQLALRDCDMGRWRGLTLGEAMAREPEAVDAWLADPRAAPHGGESLLAFITRVGGWLDTRPVEDGGRDRRRGRTLGDPGRPGLRPQGAARRRTGTSTSARCRRPYRHGPSAGRWNLRSRRGLSAQPSARALVGGQDQVLGRAAHPPHRPPVVRVPDGELAPVEVGRAGVVGDMLAGGQVQVVEGAAVGEPDVRRSR